MNYTHIKEAAKFIADTIGEKPEIGLVLGSGLGVLADEIDSASSIPYEEIPHFPLSTVDGHAGELVTGTLSGKIVAAMKGRFHYYEGYSFEQVTFPIRVMKALGIETILVTNAAGGVNESFKPGDLMIITDHINLMGGNPLIGKNDNRLGSRFPDMTEAYSRNLRSLAKEAAKRTGISIQEGVYAANTGPAYETPAEVRMARVLGADAVGMSTVPEVIAARHGGMSVLGISCISNMAAGILDQPLSHDEVIETTEKVRVDFLSYVKEIVKSL
ncbi:purine-nucleoside phosphorylase [Domibacillus epiphyticus]|uniref:Purine nucleoside phosphorylase n=1 Tax=Domibacillus epiphyticus TaxID=1714355 RepID=A0A1V2A4I6_9BACI|nr:purine-nucleoside phosphorylase [Domibacillus epiphyticus]OMP65908.1 purine-nucleoside phosphorylase [Domibacillus epiphyticus]